MSAGEKGTSVGGMARWTREEDETLGASVRARMPWTEISVLVSRLNAASPKSPKQCCQRWQRVLNPAIRKGHWTKEEERILQAAVARLGTRAWAEVSKEIAGRTGLQCRTRWIQSQQRQRIQHQASLELRPPGAVVAAAYGPLSQPDGSVVRTHMVTHTISTPAVDLSGNGSGGPTRPDGNRRPDMNMNVDVDVDVDVDADMWQHLVRASRQILHPHGIPSDSDSATLSPPCDRLGLQPQKQQVPTHEHPLQNHKLSFSWILN